jgi:hypothetical protein
MTVTKFESPVNLDRRSVAVSESYSGGTGCLNWAHPGLRGFRGGNSPVLPGPLHLPTALPYIVAVAISFRTNSPMMSEGL